MELLEKLVAGRHLHKEEAGTFWSGLIGRAFVDPFAVVITADAVAKLPKEIATKVQALPLYCLGNVLSVATADPLDEPTIKRISHIVRMPISAVFSFPADVRDLLQVQYASDQTLQAALASVDGIEQFTSGTDLAEGGRKIAELAEADQVSASSTSSSISRCSVKRVTSTSSPGRKPPACASESTATFAMC